MKEYRRRGDNINKKFFQFLLPSLLSSIAMSLNEFVDSIIVSQLLGADAMSMVGMASPIMFLFAIISIMLGAGGSNVYAEYAGKQEKRKSEEVFSVVLIFSVLISVLIVILGSVFIDDLSNRLCGNPELIPEFKPYVIILILSSVLIIPLQVLISFFPAFGSPQTVTIVNIIANGINLLMDVIYIKFFDTGVMGAAMATFTGYLIGVIFIIVVILMKKVSLPYRKPGRGSSSIHLLLESAAKGAPGAIGQLGFLIKVSFCNHISMKIGGMVGIATFTLCMQTLSVVSVGMSGTISAMIPIGAVLEGQRDFKGLKILLRSVFVVQFMTSLILTVLFEAFPQLFCYIYNYSGENAEGAMIGIRIFSLMYLFRGSVLIFLYYFQITNRKLYASIISAIDGFAGLIPLVLILTPTFGINGLWLSFPILSILMLIVITILNLCIARNSNGKYEGILLLDTEERGVSVYDATLRTGKDVISDFVVSLENFCSDNIDNKKTVVFVTLVSEEMLSYICDHRFNKIPVEQVDLLVKIRQDSVVMDIRCIGEPIDPTSAAGEAYSNVDVLRKVSKKLDYSYVLGMNQTRITI
ncbi:MAG: hypothetical protein K6G03_09565 [Lachnospiraceae bacterium]|nr:hypothetical protein [Lachnospiraceae bacterium]